MPGGVAAGVGSAAMSTIMLSAVTAWLVERGSLSQEKMGYAAMIVLLLSGYMGAEMAYRKIRERKTMVCLLTGAGYFLLLLCVTAMVFGGQYRAVGVSAFLIFGGAGCAALIRKAPFKRGNRRRIKGM